MEAAVLDLEGQSLWDPGHLFIFPQVTVAHLHMPGALGNPGSSPGTPPLWNSPSRPGIGHYTGN